MEQNLILIYVLGVFCVITVAYYQIRQEKTVRLSMFIEMIVFAMLSWAFFILALEQKIVNWMTDENHDPVLWHNKED